MINTTISNYKITAPIGEGGMGTVYLGSHLKLDRKVAIKVLLPELAGNQQIRERFINEANTLCRLNHQNIVTLYDFAEDEKNLFLIMEYAEGTPLDVVIEKITGPITEARCIKIFEQILSGFAYAHSKGIVHRDIKSSNIILQSDDTPKILDFGIAKIVEGDVHLTKTGTRMGSVAYMSPEQVMAKDLDYRSDIYSLGITLFEMLSGRLPYDANKESEFEIQTKIVKEPLQPIRNVNPNVSSKMEDVIFRATSKEPNDRFQSCDEFKQALYPVTTVPQQTIIQTPEVSRTVIQAPGQSYQLKRRAVNPLFYITPVAVVLLILVYFLFIRKDEAGTTAEKNVLTSNGNNTSSNKLPFDFNIGGTYSGYINGRPWNVVISNFDGRNFSGYNSVRWPSKVVSANFTGTFDKSTGKIIMDEEPGKGSGRFEGQFQQDGKSMSGDWYRYSDNGSFTWTLSKGEQLSQNNFSATPGKYPQGSDRQLNSSDVSYLTNYELKIMRNEIYARHGYIFQTDDMRNYFSSQGWYSPQYSNVESMLTSVEKENIALIKSYER